MTEPFVTDPWILVACGAIVVVVFCLGLLVPRRPRLVRAPVTDAKLDAIYQRLNKVEERQTQNDHDTRNIRMAMDGMPTQKSITELLLQVATLSGNVSTLAGKVESVQETLGTNTHTLNRMQDFLYAAAADTIANKHRAD